MKLKVIGSSSAGNCYILDSEKTEQALIIECGVRVNDIKKALDFNLAKVAAAIVTHEHIDHACAVKDLLQAGIQVFATAGTFNALNIQHRNTRVMKPGSTFYAGDFKVIAFDVKHDAAEPVGFLISHQETGNILFLSDSYYVRYTFKELNHIIIEANYSDEILQERIRHGEGTDFLCNRVLQSHMSLRTCKELLSVNDLQYVNNIVLIHLSDSNSNAELFKKDVRELTGKNVYVAEAGMEIEFNRIPF